MHYIHEQGIYKCTMALDNLVVIDGVCRFIDFTSSLPISNDENGQATAFPPFEHIGQLEYTAPEVAKGLPFHGQSADIWSCGVILFNILTHVAFSYETLLMSAIDWGLWMTKVRQSIADSVSPEASELLSMVLAFEPENRPDAQAILNHPWLSQ
jgi:serine/threonine protein kinase